MAVLRPEIEAKRKKYAIQWGIVFTHDPNLTLETDLLGMAGNFCVTPHIPQALLSQMFTSSGHKIVWAT